MNNEKRVAFLRKQLDECNLKIAYLENENTKLLQENKSLIDSVSMLHEEMCSFKDEFEDSKNKYNVCIQEFNLEKNRYLEAIRSVACMKKKYQDQINKLLAGLAKHI